MLNNLPRLHIPPALKHRRFFFLWLGLAISVTGSQMQLWTLFWHVSELSGEEIAVAGIGAARIVPIILFSLIGGLVADSANRRTVMSITQTVLALLAAAFGVLTLTGVIQLWHIYLITGLQAVAMAFDLPARQALVPNLVPAKDLPNAFSMTSLAFQTGSVLGPGLSGLMIAAGGLEWVYFVNAASYAGVLLALIAIGDVPQQIVQRTRGLKARIADIGEGITFIRTHPIILSTMLIDFVATFFSSANTLMPFVAREVLKVGPVEYGWLSASQSVGAITAAFVISQIKEIRRQGPIFLASVGMFGLATIVFGLSTGLWMAMGALMIVGASDSVSTIIRNTIRQLQTPDGIRGRMVSINQIFFTGGPQLGEIEAGIVAQLFGAPFAIASGGVMCIVAIAGLVRRWPQLLSFNGDEPIAAGDSLKQPVPAAAD